MTSLTDLPPEILEAILLQLQPGDLIAASQTSRLIRSLSADAPLIWRGLCRVHFQSWAPHHRIDAKFSGPLSDVNWRKLFMYRVGVEKRTLQLLNDALESQHGRLWSMDSVAEYGLDAKETLLRQCRCDDGLEDVLARRFYANAILERIQREVAIDVWRDLLQGVDVPLERALGAYDLFARIGDGVDLDHFDEQFDGLRDDLLTQYPHLPRMSTRNKATTLLAFMHEQGYQGVSAASYGALSNSFIGFALSSDAHETLPLISVAIYCALARRIGLDARPCGFIYHVYCIVYAPANHTLDGAYNPSSTAEPPFLYLDAFRFDPDVPLNDLIRTLRESGVPSDKYDSYLGPASTPAILIRAARNIVHSVQASRQTAVGVRGMATRRNNPVVDADNAFYGALWAMLILAPGLTGGLDPEAQASQRRQYLPYLLEHVDTHHPWDLSLLEHQVAPFFSGQADSQRLVAYVHSQRAKDRFPRPVRRRKTTSTAMGSTQEFDDQSVRYKVGTLFTHKRYGYEGAIIGWDTSCEMEEEWIQTQGVDRLPEGRQQSFYHVLSADKSTRYVAQENIVPFSPRNGLSSSNTGRHGHPALRNPSEAMLKLAGRYFKRWDAETGRFVSNVRDEYPDD